ncbi:hypothetical protein [Streptococcus jiangjianxini]|uniref:hypothetical protein n=1 Tax=Streptococcus jiangjianxini TaxID=3161189 RepID=UPI0032EF31CB
MLDFINNQVAYQPLTILDFSKFIPVFNEVCMVVNSASLEKGLVTFTDFAGAFAQ